MSKLAHAGDRTTTSPARASARSVCDRLLQHGVLSKDTHHTVVRFAPPLIITREQINEALAALRATLAEFEAKRAEGTLRHVGITESMHMIARHLGWTLDQTTESLSPIIANREIRSGYKPIRRGQACGVEQIGRATCKDREVLKLHFRAAVGESESFDRVEIAGEPPFTCLISGGINGDIASCAITINAIRSIVKAAPGLRTMIDLPPVGFTAAF